MSTKIARPFSPAGASRGRNRERPFSECRVVVAVVEDLDRPGARHGRGRIARNPQRVGISVGAIIPAGWDVPAIVGGIIILPGRGVERDFQVVPGVQATDLKIEIEGRISGQKGRRCRRGRSAGSGGRRHLAEYGRSQLRSSQQPLRNQKKEGKKRDDDSRHGTPPDRMLPQNPL